MKLNRKYTVAWAGLTALFLGIEGAALLNPGSGDTLSEHVWDFLAGGWSRYLLVGGLLSWLVVHFLGRGRAG